MTTNIEKWLSEDFFKELKREKNFERVNKQLVRYLQAINNMKPNHDTELFRDVLTKYKEYYKQYGGNY